MKKNIAMRLASLILMCTIITSCFVSSTFAKYTSNVTGTGEATVAKWDVAFQNNGETFAGGNKSFNLWNTAVLDTDGSTETDVKSGLIAPGTKGNFNFGIVGQSEVTVNYTITLTVQKPANLPIKFYSDAAMNTELTLKSGTTDTYEYTGTVAVDTAASVSKTIYWQWAYEQDHDNPDDGDTTDTGIGAYGNGTAPSVVVTATLTATQAE